MRRIVLVTRDADLEARLREAFDGTLNGQLRCFGGELETEDDASTMAELVHGGADVVAFGADVGLETALHLAQTLDREHPEISVIFVAKPTAKMWEQALRAGVDAVVPLDADASELRAEFERALRATDKRRENIVSESEPGARRRRVITVLAPKGGSGRTVVATNLAVGLAQAAPGQVVVVDLDLQFGDVAGALQLVPERTIADAARAPGELDGTGLKVFLTAHPANLYALCAPESPVDGEEVPAGFVTRALELLSEEFRFVVVDTSAGIDEYALAALDIATDFVLVGATDVPSVRGLRKEVEALEHLGLHRQVRHFVLNRADARVGLDLKDVEATVGMRVDVAVPSSRAVPMALNQGLPVVQSDPRSPVARELTSLVERFAELPVAAGSGGGIRPWRRN